MIVTKPDTMVPTWDRCPLVERIKDARQMLFVYDFLTVAESMKIRKRIEKWLAKAKKEGGKK